MLSGVQGEVMHTCLFRLVGGERATDLSAAAAYQATMASHPHSLPGERRHSLPSQIE